MKCQGYACSVPGQPVVVSCAERERPSRPFYIAGGSGLEAPWLKLQTGKKDASVPQILYCIYHCGHIGWDNNLAKVCFIPAIVSSTLISTFSSSKTDSRTVSTMGSFSLARASNSYSSSRVSVGSFGKFPRRISWVSLASRDAVQIDFGVIVHA